MIVPLFVQCDQPPFLALDCEQYEDGPTPSDMSVETSTAASLTAKVVGRIHLISRTVLNTRLPSEVRDFQAERFDQWVAFRMRSYTRVRIHILGAAALGKHSNWCALGTKAAPLYLAPKKTCILTHAMTPSWRCCVASKVPKASLRRNEAPEVSSTPRAKASSKARCRSWRFTDTASQGEKAHF